MTSSACYLWSRGESLPLFEAHTLRLEAEGWELEGWVGMPWGEVLLIFEKEQCPRCGGKADNCVRAGLNCWDCLPRLTEWEK